MSQPRIRAVALLVLAYLAFISIGLPDGLIGVAWPSIRATYSVPLDALGALLIATTAGYVTSSFASGPILTRLNLGMLLALSAGATAISLLAYTVAPEWAVMVSFGVLAGLGAGAIDAGLNTFVATHYSARTLNMLHAFYGLGTTAGPMIMTGVLIAHLPWQRGYLLVGAAQMALAIGFALTRSLWPSAGTPLQTAAHEAVAVTVTSTLRLPAVWLGIGAFAVYVGVEAAAGVWVYTWLSEGRGLGMRAAGTGVSLYWAGLLCSRVAFGLLPAPRQPAAQLRGCISGVAVAAVMLIARSGVIPTLIFVAVLGLASGPIFPSLIATTPARVGGAHTANAVGFQVAAAALGQSILPASIGVLAQHLGLEVVPVGIFIAAVVLFGICEWMAAMPRSVLTHLEVTS